MDICIKAYTMDHPEVFWLDVESGYKYYEYDNSLGVELKYSQSGDELEHEKKELDEVVERVASAAPDNATDYDIELYLNDYLTKECSYNTDVPMKHTSYVRTPSSFFADVWESPARSSREPPISTTTPRTVICGTAFSSAATGTTST